MLLVIDRHNGVPAYRQIMDQIKFQIAADQLKPGDTLPSTRALAGNLALNPMTVSKAYSLLEHEKVVVRRPGMALVVSPRNRTEQREAVADQLRQALDPAVTRVAQLDVPLEDAVRLFRVLLEAKQNLKDAEHA